MLTRVDKDGWGDKCDNCKPFIDCQDPALCANPKQTDTDGDAIGDICDPQPKPDCVGQDKDGDGLPDLCDPFPGPAPATAYCGQLSDCPTALGQNCLTDGANGKCTKLPDVDQDGIPDLVDLCPNYQATDNSNTNSINEAFYAGAGVEVRGDPCDPAPSLKASFKPYIPPDLKTPPVTVDTVNFTTQPVLGKTDPSATKKTIYFGQEFHRGCNCTGLSGPLKTPEACALSGPCTPAQLDKNLPGKWRTITVHKQNSADVIGPTTGSPATFADNLPGPPKSLVWEAQADWKAGNLDGELYAPDPNHPSDKWFYGLLGIEASVPPLPPKGPVLSSREINNNLRDSYLSVTFGGTYKGTPYPGPPIGPGVSCYADPTCGMFAIFDPSIVVDPERGWEMPGRPELLGAHGGTVFTTFQNGYLDITSYVSQVVKDQLTAGQRWLNPVESRSKLIRAGLGNVHAVALPQSVDATTKPSVLDSSSGVFSLIGGRGGRAERGVASPLALAAVGQEASGPGAPVNAYSAAFSALRNKLLVAGGQRPDGDSVTIWQFHLDRQVWEPAVHMATPKPSGKSLAMTWDVDNNVAYVLSQVEHTARLVAYDLTHDKAVILGSWFFSKKNEAFFLNVLDDGQLALTTTRKDHHQVFRFRVEGTKIKLTGVSLGNRRVASAPVLGSDGLYLPLLDKKGRAAFERIEFFPGQPCKEL